MVEKSDIEKSDTYSPLHMLVLAADGWKPKNDEERREKVNKILDKCDDVLKVYEQEKKEPDITLHGDIAYALRIAANLAGPNYDSNNAFAIHDIIDVAHRYNSLVRMGSTLDKVLLQYDVEGEPKRGYIALDKRKLILGKEVA